MISFDSCLFSCSGDSDVVTNSHFHVGLQPNINWLQHLIGQDNLKYKCLWLGSLLVGVTNLLVEESRS